MKLKALRTIKFLSSVLAVIVLAVSAGKAQIVTIPVVTADNALVLQVDTAHYLNTIYYGPKLTDQEEYKIITSSSGDYTGMLKSAYTPAGSRNLAEPAITLTHADGNTSLDLKYISHNVTKVSNDVALLSVVLKDPVYNLQVTLYYKSYYKDNLIEQWCVIRNAEKGNVTLYKFASANLNLSADAFWLRHYHGDWAKEMRPEETPITHDIVTIDSKLGTRANLFQPSVFMVSLDKPATEDEGKVFYGGMEWSGNFRVDLELDPQNDLRIIAGINNFASNYLLKPGEDFTTPAFWYTFSDKGRSGASRNVQSWARNYKLVDGKGTRMTLLNNWESTGFDFNETRLKSLLQDTKNLGVDLFLLDDGWFGNKYPRNDDHAGLGDWQETKSKLPDGLVSLVKEAQHDDVKFGIWIEPEMVNPKSALYAKHPEWVIKQPQRPEYYFRNQLVLDLSNPKVQDFVYGIVDSLFIKNPGLAFIKWDCNAVIYNAYSAHLTNQSALYIDYVEGLYKVLARIRAKYPVVPMMLCSGGGGRVDYGALQYFTEYWPSDNTDPLERIFMQWEYSYFYPAIASSNHVTDWGKQPLKFRTDVAMMGRLGFDIDVHKLSNKDFEFCQNAIKTYDSVKAIIFQGTQYRLADPTAHSVAAMLYVDSLKSTGVMFCYLVNNRYDEGSKKPILLKGLNPSAYYNIKEINLYPGTKQVFSGDKEYSGKFLMTIGLNPEVNDSRTSVILEIKASSHKHQQDN